MALSEKIYTLRKKSGLSQEQLAEQLHVSRQAISKWESGASVPESEKLIAISTYFDVSLDDLIKEDAEDTPQEARSVQAAERIQRSMGFIICIGGIICMIVWGLLSILHPATTTRFEESSLITVDGNGIFLILCAAAIVVGAVLILKDAVQK